MYCEVKLGHHEMWAVCQRIWQFLRGGGDEADDDAPIYTITEWDMACAADFDTIFFNDACDADSTEMMQGAIDSDCMFLPRGDIEHMA